MSFGLAALQRCDRWWPLTGCYHRAPMLNRRRFLSTVSVSLLAAPRAVEGQQAGKVWRIGVLRIGPATEASTGTLRQALRELGYVEGRNATTTIPVVMLATDPLGAGLIDSLARPGGNVTGVATLESELGAKRLEHFKEAFPAVTRVAVLHDPTTSPTVLKETEDGGRRLKVQLQIIEARAPEDLDGAFRKAADWRAAALSILASPFFQSQRSRIATLGIEHRLPTMVPHRAYVEAGGFISYGPDFRDLGRRTAVFVDKILKGAKPADLPVEQATKFELVINMKTAKALGLTIPPSLLLRADQVIE